MKKKTKIIIAIVAVVLVIVSASVAYIVTSSGYKRDPNDTEELYNTNIASVGYENTVETAIPQTELYNIVNEHFASELPEGKTEKKAIIIGYDGCRADILATKSDSNSAVSSVLKDGGSINLLYCGGVNYPEKNTQDTSTAPGWCSILTGQWADVHGVTANDIPKSMEAKTLMTTLTEDGTIDSASFITKWAGHFSRKNATYLPEVEYCGDHGLPVTFSKCDNDEASHKAVMEEIADEACSDFIFVIYEPTDSTGHNKGFSFNNPEYKDAFTKMDAYGYEAIEAIKARETYDTEDWLIIVTSDHGGIGTGHGGKSIQERMTFAVMNKEFDTTNTVSSEDNAPLTDAQAIRLYNEAYEVAVKWFDLYFSDYVSEDFFTDQENNSYYAVNSSVMNSVDSLKKYLYSYFSENLVDSIVSEIYLDKDGKLYRLAIETGDFMPVYHLDLTKANLISETDTEISYDLILTQCYDEEIFGEETYFEEETINIKYVYENGKWVIDNYFEYTSYYPYEWNNK